MGLKDWLDEVNEQKYEDEREEARDRYKNDPVALDRALRRIDARAKPGTPWGMPEQEPDLATMDKAQLEELRDTLEVEIEEKERALNAAKEYGENVREVLRTSLSRSTVRSLVYWPARSAIQNSRDDQLQRKGHF